ncbi:MAG TPA: glycosyltransferase [Anaerolineae bacterium]|nr:glycosyltransferase [Anaerolineae bacterium]HID83871.1 glycosyltransferase [Anaerolineales bacterium]HIQ08924.1 glycosyltransferase [Anaerolineaceae bacterium]
MTRLPLVSIVTPSYNQASFLERTLRSVLSQDYPHIEYIVVDGGSTDGSVAVIERYAHRLAWWVSEPDQGQAEAINKGFARAQGEIFAWVNSDDLLAPWTVAEAVAAFQRHPEAGLVFGHGVSIDAQGRPFHLLRTGPWGLAELMTFHMLNQPAVFLRRAAWEAVGGLDLGYHYLLDHHLWLRMAAQAPTAHVDRIWAFARYHAAAKNAAQASGFAAEALRLAHWMSTEPALASTYARLRRRVWAAAYRFAGRYLVDGGHYLAALGAYLRALAYHPPTAAKEAHRMAFALAGLFGLGGALRRVYYRRAWGGIPPEVVALGVTNADAWVMGETQPPSEPR